MCHRHHNEGCALPSRARASARRPGVPAHADAVTVRDAVGRNVEVKDASRIVSIGGAVTEILYALGLERPDRRGRHHQPLSRRGAEAEAERRLYARAVAPRACSASIPSLVLAIDGAGPKETVAVLEAATVPLVRVPDRYTGEGIVEKIKLVADVAGDADRGECLAAKVGDDLAALARCARTIKQPKKVLFVLSLLNGKPMVAGRNTAADGIIKLAGGVNAIDAYEGYKQISDEAIIAAGPDTVLVMQRQQEPLDAKTRVRARGLRDDAGGGAEIFHRDGRALSARLRPAHRDGGARSRRRALSGAWPRGAAVGERQRPAAADDDRPPASAACSARRTRCGRPSLVLGVLLGALVIAAAVAASVGAAGIPLSRLPAALGLGAGDPRRVARDQLVLWSIRLPRIAIAIMIGALLAAGGTVMQGLFRNPLADPALVGISPGAGFAAALAIVIGDRMLARQPRCRSRCCRSRRSRARWSTTVILYRLATRAGRTSIATLLLAGIAIGALANAGIGFLVFLADDRQLRDITFWLLGSLGGATWGKVAAIAPFVALMLRRPAVHRARARPDRARRGGGVPHGHRGRAAQAHRDRAGRGVDRRGGVGRGRDRLRRHRGAASAAARDRAGPSAAAAGRAVPRRDPAAASPTPSRASSRRRPSCRSAS